MTHELGRPVTVHFRGDWGQANMTRICGWLAQEMGDRTAAGSRFAIWSGRGGRDQLDALAHGTVDIAVVTPTAAVGMFHHGLGPAPGPLPWLRALGVVGHRDRLVVAVDADLPAGSVAELSDIAGRLTIATSPDDGVNLVGLAAQHALRLAGADPVDLVGRGAVFRYAERPFPAIRDFADGEANVLIHEAVMTPPWQRIADRRPVRYLAWGEKVLDGFAEWAWPEAIVDAGYLPGLAAPLHTLDFSDFALLCREDLPDDIAYLAAWCLVRTRRALEAQYAHIDPDHSPVTYPLDPAAMARTPVPLHPGARRAYADLEVTAWPT